MGAITRAERNLLEAVDIEYLKENERILGKCLDHKTSFVTDERDCFTLQTCLVNIFIKSHVDCRDVKNGGESICLLDEFEDVDFCITELKRRWVYRVGSISILKSEQ